jgi:hypothetical protein
MLMKTDGNMTQDVKSREERSDIMRRAGVEGTMIKKVGRCVDATK